MRDGHMSIFWVRMGSVLRPLDIPHWHIKEINDISYVLTRALEEKGPTLIEVDMLSIGKFAKALLGRRQIRTG